MLPIRTRQSLLALCVIGITTAAVFAEAAGPDAVVSDRVKLLTRGTQWKQVADYTANPTRGLRQLTSNCRVRPDPAGNCFH